jgi:hypothetical protein
MICNKPLRIESSDGCENTIINCDGEGGVVINHKDAVFTGFTLTNFAVSVKSPALYLKNGLASNLVINCYNDAKGSGNNDHVVIVAVCTELTDSVICGNNKPYLNEYTYVMNATLKRVKFINNKSKYTIVRFGNLATTVRSKLYDCEFINNSIDSKGRGLFSIYQSDPGADMYRCKFIGNTVSDGPIMSFYGHTVNHCIFADNNCKDILYMPNDWGALSTVRNTLLVNNTVKRNVIRKEAKNANSALEIENVTIAHNTSSGAECAGVYVNGYTQKQTFGMYNTIVSSKDKMDIAEMQYNIKLREYNAAKIKYELGVIANVELTKAINDLYDAQVSYANAKLNYRMAIEKYEYEITTGL